MTVATRSGYAVFQPRARLLKLIGAELISDDIVAVTELVKNGHDADARLVTIEFRGVTTPEGRIIVRDDGCGMDVHTLLHHWMEPAGTSKSGCDAKQTPCGRRVLGEKGVGRFAADKLGRSLELVSRRRGDAHEVWAAFDWDEFDTDSRMLSEIPNRWEVRPVAEIAEHGTILKISGLRSGWTERMFRRLSTRLSRLRSPFSEFADFTIRIESDEFPEYAGELRVDFLERAPYRIDAIFDGNQTIELNVNGSRSVDHLWNGAGDLRCGLIRVRLFAFDLETDALAKIGSVMDIRAWLREWSGVSVYRDGFRIWPYGEPHDDWLRLDRRRVNNPVVRLSNNQIVGFVEISRDRNPDLVDQTNREGLLHNRAFEDLRQLLYFILQVLEAERQARRHPVEKRRQTPGTTESIRDTIPETLERLAGRAAPGLSRELGRLAIRLREEIGRQELRHRRLVEGYTELAALGHVMAAAVAQLRELLEAFQEEREAIRFALTRAVDSAIRSSRHTLEASMRRAVRQVPGRSGRRHVRRTSVADGIWGVGIMAATPLLFTCTAGALGSLRENLLGALGEAMANSLAPLEGSLTALHRQLSAVLPPETGSASRKRTVDLIEELHMVRRVLLPYLQARGVRIDVLGSRPALLRVEMRPEMLHSLVYLLVANSVEWTRGTKNRRVRIVAKRSGENCEIIISDNGPGISAGLAGRVFEPLFSTKENGRGMGLAIARDIVERHGGCIEVLTDRRRRGANIRIRLPRRRTRAAHSAP